MSGNIDCNKSIQRRFKDKGSSDSSNSTKDRKKAFAKCKNLKKITIKTTYLSSKKVGANAFKGIHAKATTIKVPKKQKKAYQKLLKARGVGKKVTVK